MEFSNNLIKLRKQKGLSQEGLAEKIGVSRQAISKWENQESYPDLPKLISLSQVLECSLDELCGKTKEINSNSKVSSKKTMPKYLLIALLIGSFLLGNIFSNFNSNPLPESVKISGLEFLSRRYSLDITFMSDCTSDNYTYETVFTSNYQDTVKSTLECKDGVCKGNVQLTPNYEYYASLIIRKGNKEKVIPIAEKVEYYEDYASWKSLY